MIYERKDKNWVQCNLIRERGPKTGGAVVGKACEKIMEET
jgi:hypothetical protein